MLMGRLWEGAVELLGRYLIRLAFRLNAACCSHAWWFVGKNVEEPEVEQEEQG